MKKLIFFLLLAGFLTTANAQKQTYQEKKAISDTAYITEKMELNEDKTIFLHNVLLDKYQTVSKQTKGLDLSKEAKKTIYKESYKTTVKKLTEQFTEIEVKAIFSFLKEINSK